MKKIISAFLCIALSFFLIGGSAAYAEANDKISAKAYVLIDAATGKILSESSSSQRLSIASTTKIMTALITLEQKNIDTKFVVDTNAIKVEGTSMGLRIGDVVSLRTLATGMLLPSGNDAANAAAVKISGSLEAFSKKMNEKAKEIGMVNSNFVTPSGLDHENHFSTAYDMAILARKALQNKVFADICKSESVLLQFGAGENPPKRRLYNHNRLVKTYEGCIGVKTGFTKKAGRCLVSAATRNGVTLICVTLGASDDWNVHKNLFDYGFSTLFNHVNKVVLKPFLVDVVGGDKKSINAVAVFDSYETTADKALVKDEIFIDKFLYAPVKKGDIVGYIEHSLSGVVIAKTPIAIAESVDIKSDDDIKNSSSFFEKIDDFFKKILRTYFKVS